MLRPPAARTLPFASNVIVYCSRGVVIDGGADQAPVPELHAPATWQLSRARQTTGLAPVHVPLWQVSTCVHPFPSLQAVPSAWFGFEQPVAGVHVPAT